MQLHLIRHADAEAVGTGSVRNDAQRPLSTAGRRVAARVGARLAEMEVRFDRIGSSPLMRAVQTAEIVAGATGYAGRVDCLPFLSTPRAWRAELPALLGSLGPAGDAASLALVGHNPDIGDIVTHFLEMPDGGFPFPPATVVRLDVGVDGSARLGWWLEPSGLALHRDV